MMLSDPQLSPLPPVPHLVEVWQIARRLSVSPGFVRRLIRDGKLPAIRLGGRWRVDLVDLHAFVEAERMAQHAEPPDPHPGRNGLRSHLQDAKA